MRVEMSQKRALTFDDIDLGEALKWDIYDAQDNLLLRQGYVIASTRQLESLVERGLFADAEAYALTHPDTTASGDNEDSQKTPSALRHIKAAQQALRDLLTDLEQNPETSRLPERVHGIAENIEHAVRINPDLTLACLLFRQTVHHYAVRHCVDAATIAIILAQGMGKPDNEVRTIACSALTMNLSMLALQEALQSSKDGPDPDQQSMIRQHPEISVKLLEKSGVKDAEWLSNVLHHHENIDGSGYPSGKAGDAIPDNAKLISLTDRYTAMLAPRAYRNAMLPNEALRGMLLDRGKGVDAAMAAHFIRTLGIYPPGTFVKLQCGETAIVSHRGKNSAAPVAHSLIGPFGAPMPYPHKRDTDNPRYAIREAVSLDQDNISFTMQQIWGTDGAI